jgi:transcription elongation factor Elf1
MEDWDSGSVIAFFVIGIILVFGLVALAMSNEKFKATVEAAREARHEKIMQLREGSLNPALICPHCQTKGQVRVKAIKHKSGISGGKAAAAVLTAGVSVLATGLSRKEAMTQAKCGNCGSTWRF